MKRCPVCQRSYDDTLTYCLEDGSALLADTSSDADLPATLIIPDPRTTIPANQETFRPRAQPPQGYTQPQPPSWQPAMTPQTFPSPAVRQGRAAAVTALILAIVAYLLLGFCIIGGATGVNEQLLGGIFLFSVLLALTGAILGIVAISKSSKDTGERNAKALSIIALVLNGLYLLISVGFLILAAVAGSK